MSTSAILVFVKAPQPGLVKTRLIPLIGERRACELHRAMVMHSVNLATSCEIINCDVQVWCTPDTGDHLFAALQRDFAVTLHVQTGDDLGIRMYHAFQHALSEHDRAVVIGCDCPVLNQEIIEQAFTDLQNNDTVIAPAEDGGYVLLGLNKAVKDVFLGINWGAGDVTDHTLKNFQQLGLAWKELPTLWDVDRPGDLQRLVKVYSQFNLHTQLQTLLKGLETNRSMSL